MSEPSARARIAEDEHGVRTTFEEIEVGTDLGELEWEVGIEDLEKQCAMDDDYDPWFIVDSPYGGRIAPPQIQYRPPRWLLSRNYNVRGLFYKWEFENLAPIHPGRKIRVSGRIADKWIDRDREFLRFEAVAHDERGEVLFTTSRVHVLDIVERTAPRQGRGTDSGIKAEHI